MASDIAMMLVLSATACVTVMLMARIPDVADRKDPHRDEFEHSGKSIVITWYADNSSMSVANGEHLALMRQIETPISCVV